MVLTLACFSLKVLKSRKIEVNLEHDREHGNKNEHLLDFNHTRMEPVTG
jgi:hypothetical protein